MSVHLCGFQQKSDEVSRYSIESAAVSCVRGFRWSQYIRISVRMMTKMMKIRVSKQLSTVASCQQQLSNSWKISDVSSEQQLAVVGSS